MKRVKRLACRIVGHTTPQPVAGFYQGFFVKADICQRCHHVFRSRVGKRQHRREQVRRTA